MTTPEDRVQDEMRVDRFVDDPERVSAAEMAAAKNRTLGEALREGLRRRGLSPRSAQEKERVCPECGQTGSGVVCHHWDVTGERKVPTVAKTPEPTS